jgi:methyl-accepting chemotaxis protein
VVESREVAPHAPDAGRALQALVETAERAAAEHDAAVERTLASTERQHDTIAALRRVTTVSAESARGVAGHATQLAAAADRLPADLAASRESLSDLAGAARRLAEATVSGRGAVQRLDSGWAGVADAIEEIARAARRARVLAVNASIEAAYVDASSSGFAIVAERMRALSTSTLAAATDVRAIVGATRGEVAEVIVATRIAETSCSAVATTLDAAIVGFADGMTRGTAFAAGVAQLATIAEEQGAASAQIATTVQRLDALATAAGEDARAAARGVGASVVRARRALAGGDAAAAVAALTDAAIAAARGEAGWRGVDDALASLAAEFEQVSAALEQSGQAALALETAASEIVAALDQLDAVLRAALNGFEHAIADVRVAEQHGDAVRGGIVAMHRATDRAGTIVETVSEISAESGLLAINAAIEAARAGERGLGFTVIADEIGRLARGTQDVTGGVAEAIGKLRERGERLERASSESAGQMTSVVDQAEHGRATVDALRASIVANVERGRALAETARGLGTGAQAIAAEIARARGSLGALGATERDAARLALSDVLGDAQATGIDLGLGLPLARYHTILAGVAEETEAIYAEAIAAGRTTIEDVRATDYVELRGDEVGHLGRFVDIRTAPRNGFSPPKYRTVSDAAVDRQLMALFDRSIAAAPAIRSMAGMDLNTFLIALPSFSSTTEDWSRNRVKKILEDPISLRLARVGLGAGAERSGRRRAWNAFARDGYALHRVSPRPWGAYAYLQDTGEVFVNLATAVYVGEVRVATVSLILDAETALR